MGRSLAGKVALVTGASQGGTGTATATRFAAEGAKVAITARSAAGLAETVQAIEAIGGTVLSMPCDLGDPDGGRDTLVARTEAAFGPIDILVNNAVTHALKRVEDWTLDEMRHHAEVNLWTPWLIMTQVIPGMKERGSGWILNLSSFSAETPPGPPFSRKALDGSSLYGAMKAALNRMSVAAAGELHGIVAVNTLAPQAAILTPLIQLQENFSLYSHLLEPVDAMAEAALALCSGDPAVLTGRIAFSLQLLLELARPMLDVTGQHLVEGWQPYDLVNEIKRREEFNASGNWPDSYNFHRVHTPYPAALADA